MEDELRDQDLSLPTAQSPVLSRRGALKLLTGLGVVALVGCASKSTNSSQGSTSTSTGSSGSTGATTATTAAASAAATTAIPEETAGPYPGDGSNGPNVLTESGVVRSDITTSFGSASGTAEGIPTTIELTITEVSNGGAPYAGAAVYLWHCDRDGQYSLYSPGVTDQNYLRGVQEADADGKVTFASIFPAAYSGRWPHIHFEVFPSLDAATSAGNKIATSQVAIPEDICTQVYATSGYEQSVRNLAQTSLATDNVFSDGADQELATVSGDPDSGITLRLTVPV